MQPSGRFVDDNVWTNGVSTVCYQKKYELALPFDSDSTFVLEASASGNARTTGVRVLLDTGAAVTTASYELAERIDMIITPTDVRLHTANMQELYVLGKAELTIAFADHAVSSNTMRFEVIIVKDKLPQEIILGRDQLWGRADRNNLSLTPDADQPGGVLLRFGQQTPARLQTREPRRVAPIAAIAQSPPAKLEAVLARAEVDAISQLTAPPLRLSPKLRSDYVGKPSPNLPKWRAPGGPDTSAFEHVLIDGSAEPEVASVLRALNAQHATTFGGLKLPGCDMCPPVSRLPAMPIALLNDTDVDNDLVGGAVRLSDDEQRFVIEQQEAFEREGRLQATVGTALAFAFIVTSGALKKLRMVEAFQRLNKRIWALHWPLPSPDRIQERLASFNVFGKADMWSFFYQIALDADCTPLTAVNFAGRIREWLVIPMGIKTAPSWAQRVLSAVLDKHTERWTVVVYIDDVLIGAVDSAAFIEAWHHVLTQCSLHKITITAPKTQLAAREIEALGALVSHNSIKPPQKRLEAIRDYPEPKTVTQLRTWLGMLNQISANVNFGPLLYPLQEAAATTFAKNQKIIWTDAMRENYRAACARVADARALSPFDASRQAYLITDASDTGCGGLLAHLDHAITELLVVDAFSHRFTSAELNYPTVEQEAIAIREAAQRWRHYLRGRKIIVACDNQSVVELLQNAATSSNARLRATASELLDFDFYYVHVAGAMNHGADALSRLPLAPPVGHVMAIAESLLTPRNGDTTGELSKLIEQQRRDDKLALVLRMAENPNADRPASTSKTLWRELHSMDPRIESDGALTVLAANRRCLVVPDGWRARVLRAAHLPSHIGTESTLRLLRASFWWPNMLADARQALEACAVCCRVDARRKMAPGHSGNVEAAGGPAHCFRWQLDTFHAGSTFGDARIVVALEEQSGAQFSLVVPDGSAEHADSAYVSLIERPYGDAGVVSIDNGTEFHGSFLSRLIARGVKVIFGLPDHHGGQARIERSNRERGDRLAKRLLDNNKIAPRNTAELQQWLDAIDAAANSVPLSNGISPAELLTGRQRRIPVGMLAPRDLTDVFANAGAQTADVATQFRMQQAALKFVAEDRDNMRKAARASRDEAAGEPRLSFNIGDLVWARHPKKLHDGTDKIHSRLEYSGVFRIVGLDAPQLRATLRLLAPLPRYNPAGVADSQPAELDCTFTVHFNDMLPFVEGKPIDSAAQIAPFHVLAPTVAFYNSTLFDADASHDPMSAATAAIKNAIDSMLSSILSHKASATLDQAIARLKAKRDTERLLAESARRTADAKATRAAESAARAAREEEQRQLNAQEQHLLARPHDEPNFTEILDVSDNTVTGSFKLYRGRRYPNGIKRTRSTSELTPGERYLVDQWLKANTKS
jgi:hypothetical protein